jgi:hypothetical protein
VPETAAPEGGDAIDTVGGADVAEFSLFVLLGLWHPMQNCARTTSRQS